MLLFFELGPLILHFLYFKQEEWLKGNTIEELNSNLKDVIKNENFGLNFDRIKQLKKEIIILHPGPINRGVEISSDVADSSHSIILDQVQNGVAIRMAIIYLLGSNLNIKFND